MRKKFFFFLNDGDKKIRNKAEKILKELQVLLNPEIETEEPIAQLQTKELEAQQPSLDVEKPEAISQINTIDVGIPDKEEDNLKSLEFCFLNDLISAEDNNQMHLFELDFELVATPLEDLEDKQEINEIHKKEENRKEEKVLSSLIENIISFPKKFKEKFNG